jgi:hypothetical protein
VAKAEQYCPQFLIKSNQMESEMVFKVYYGGVFVIDMIAHSKWEAIEKAWAKFSPTRPLLKREKFKAKVRK